MKIVVTLIAVAVMSAAATYVLVSGKKTVDREVADESAATKHSEQLAELRSQLKAAEARQPEVRVQQVVVPGASTDSPQAILEHLKSIDLSAEDRSSNNTDAHRIQVRQVIRQFEALTAMGPRALPSIEAFLAQNMDLEYRENTREIISGNWSEGRIYSDPIFPPSLRIGLLNTVRHIGKRDANALPAAEHALLAVLKKTRRAIEVAYIAGALEDLSPEAHKETYLLATRDLLSLPIREEGREVSFLDRQNRGMLFNILRQHKDTRFVDQAKTQLVRTGNRRDREGNEVEFTYLDRSVLGYLTGVLGSQSMPILADLYDHPDLDDRNRSSIRQIAANYMGVSGDANVIVNKRMAESFQMLASSDPDPNKQKRSRYEGLRNVQYYLGRLGEGRNVAPETLQARQQYLSTLRVQTQDKEVLAWMDRTQQRLQDMADPEKAKRLDGRFDPRRGPSNNRQR